MSNPIVPTPIEISHSVAHYLKAIQECHEEYGYARVTDIAEKLNLKKSSVSIQVGKLEQRGLITFDPNKHIRLSDQGLSLSGRCIETKATLHQFFRDVLNVSEPEAERDACQIEHKLSNETLVALVRFLKIISHHPELRTAIQSELGGTVSGYCPEMEQCPVCTKECILSIVQKSERHLNPATSPENC